MACCILFVSSLYTFGSAASLERQTRGSRHLTYTCAHVHTRMYTHVHTYAPRPLSAAQCTQPVSISALGPGVTNVNCPTTGAKKLNRGAQCDVKCKSDYKQAQGTSGRFSCSSLAVFTPANIRCYQGKGKANKQDKQGQEKQQKRSRVCGSLPLSITSPSLRAVF